MYNTSIGLYISDILVKKEGRIFLESADRRNCHCLINKNGATKSNMNYPL